MKKMLEQIISAMEPFVTFWGKLHLPFTHKKITGRYFYSCYPEFLQGDIFLTRTSGEFSNIINPSPVKHGAIYFGKGLKTVILKKIDHLEYNNTDRANLLKLINDYKIEDSIPYVIEAVGRGTVPTDIVTFMTSKDVFIHMRWAHEKATAQMAALESLNFLLWPYDYSFKIGNKKMYCFELCATSYINTNRDKIDPMVKEVEMVNTIKAYDATTFLNDLENWVKIKDSRN